MYVEPSPTPTDDLDEAVALFVRHRRRLFADRGVGVERAEAVELALLLMLERLTPAERAA
ncbi:hypothetical protein AB0I51_43765 [Streptomyces sp. NPDC050549]|uniref:hypothetical protein n=1 Tax=Streptomyces sp. NPDC050549 TaxID=3155406 RepID=UPI00343B91D6